MVKTTMRRLFFKKNLKRRLLIHIGTEKTGTSTIQEFLNINREKLAKHGIGYLKSPGLTNNRKIVTFCMAPGKTDDHIQELGIETYERREFWKRDFKEEFQNEMNTLDPKIHSVIISSEHFHSRLTTEDEVRALFDLLHPFFLEIKILVYLRRQDTLAASLYSTACRVGVFMKSVIPKIVDKNNTYYNYFQLLERWAGVFGVKNIVPRIYETGKLLKNDVLSDFIDASGMIENDWELFTPTNQNQSLSAEVQNILMGFNKHFPVNAINENEKPLKKLRQNLVNKLEVSFSGESRTACRADAINFYNAYKASNRELARKWFDSNVLFSEDFSGYPEQEFFIPEKYEIIDCLFLVVHDFLKDYFLFQKQLLDKINIEDDKGVGLRDIALLFEDSHPGVALFLMQEALKYRPWGHFIQTKIKDLEERIKLLE